MLCLSSCDRPSFRTRITTCRCSLSQARLEGRLSDAQREVLRLRRELESSDDDEAAADDDDDTAARPEPELAAGAANEDDEDAQDVGQLLQRLGEALGDVLQEGAGTPQGRLLPPRLRLLEVADVECHAPGADISSGGVHVVCARSRGDALQQVASAYARLGQLPERQPGARTEAGQAASPHGASAG